MSELTKREMTVKDIISYGLAIFGYDGLYREEGKCACRLNDLLHCGDCSDTCKAGFLRPRNEDCDFRIVSIKPKSTPEPGMEPGPCKPQAGGSIPPSGSMTDEEAVETIQGIIAQGATRGVAQASWTALRKNLPEDDVLRLQDSLHHVSQRLELLRSLQEQTDCLAKFIMAEIPGEPSQNEGAIDTAIRIMKTAIYPAYRLAQKPKVTREQRDEVAQYVHRIGCVEYYNRREGHVQDMNTIPHADCILTILGLEVEDN